MARQGGIIPLKGTIGNITFYKSKAGYLAREKGGVEASRIASDPAFIRTRENGEEFGRAGKAGKLLRSAFRAMVQKAGDTYMVGRLTKAFVKVIQADALNVRGKRNVIDGEAELLQGFEFNVNGRLQSTLYAPFVANIDRPTGRLTIDIPSFVPEDMIAAPAGSTHYKISYGVAEIDFEAETFVNSLQTAGEKQIDNGVTDPFSLTAGITANSTKPLFVALGIEFLQQVNETMYSLKNGAYNALSLVLVSGLP
jgi:hypothetical protein